MQVFGFKLAGMRKFESRDWKLEFWNISNF